jgi:autotransporter-associated beta strand protein
VRSSTRPNPFQGAIVDNAGSATSLYLSNASGTTTFSGAITSSGALTWNGAGELLLSASNSYAGGTTVNSGTVDFTTNANLGAAGSTISLNGGTLLSTSSISSFSHVIATGTTGGSIVTGAGTSLQIGNFGGNAASIKGSGGITPGLLTHYSAHPRLMASLNQIDWLSNSLYSPPSGKNYYLQPYRVTQIPITSYIAVIFDGTQQSASGGTGSHGQWGANVTATTPWTRTIG